MKLSLLERYRQHRQAMLALPATDQPSTSRLPPPLAAPAPRLLPSRLPPPPPKPIKKPSIVRLEELAVRAAKAKAEREEREANVVTVEQPPAAVESSPAPDLDLADRVKDMLARGVRIPHAGSGRDRQPEDPTPEEIRQRARAIRRQWRFTPCLH